MKYTTFHEQQFRQSVTSALTTVGKILDAERNPVLAAEEPHEYGDKYELAEFLTNTAVASQMNALSALGLQPDQQKTVGSWVHDKKLPVTLRFLAEDTCTFLKEEDVEVSGGPHDASVVTTTTKSSGGMFGGKSSSSEEVTTKVIRHVKEYHWKVGVRYKLIVFPGTAIDQAIVIQQRTTETVLVTQGTKNKPLPEHTLHPPVDAALTWFIKMIAPNEQTCQFAIDREATDDGNKKQACKTPRRNKDVQAAIEFHKQLYDWSRITQGFFLQRVEKEILTKDNPVHQRPTPPVAKPSGIMEPGATGTMQGLMKEPSFNGKQIRIVEFSKELQRYKAEPVDPNAGLPPTLSIKPANIKPDVSPGSPQSGPALSTVSDEGIFCPILPLMENGSVLSMSDVGDFLQEQSRSLDEALDGLSRVYPAKQLIKLVTVAEASLVVLCKHVERLTIQYHDSIDYVEDMLKQQLVQAIGKEVGRSDFEQFMRFHNPKLFGPEFVPAPFSHAIRRPGHYPDGILSIEALNTGSSPSPEERTGTPMFGGSGGSEPIETWVRSIKGGEGPSIYLPIDAATAVEITGDRFLHGWMQHRFKSKSKSDYRLACRARQFSSFLVIVGTIAGPDKFLPKDAIILQNKDEVLIPLLTNVLPSAKEFKDAIESLSPEQQEFAKSFRSMQLESSVFGVCVVQLKPQLEKLLGLPDGALTKEIQLTQDLMSLFIDYQVPSDLLTYEGADDTTQTDKVAAVRGHVKSVMDVIAESKKKQLEEETMKADMRAEMQFKAQDQPFITPTEALLGDESSMLEASESSGRSGGGLLRRSKKKASKAPVTLGFSAAASAPSFGSGPAPAMAMQQMPAAAPPVQAQNRAERRSTTKSHVAPHSDSAQTTAPLRPLKPQDVGEETHAAVDGMSTMGEDFTMIPKILDTKLEKYDTDNALRSTIIKAGSRWTRKRQENFLTAAKSTTLESTDIATERKKAMDLLDAISRSGTLAIDRSELHVFVAVSHCFDNDVMGTVIQDNINPIAKVEKSSLMLASTIFGQPATRLIKSDRDIQRLTGAFPALFEAVSSQSTE